MFNTEDDYLNSIKDAQIYISMEAKSSNKKLFIFNFIFLALLAYLTFSYLENQSKIEALPVSKQSVLGVSEVIDDSELSNSRLMKILKDRKADTLEDSMKVFINERSIQSQSSYTEAIARELDGKSSFKGRIAVINQDNILSKN